MSTQHRVQAFVFVATCIAANVYAAPAMKEGKWEITAKLEMPGMPMQMPAHTYTHCMTGKDMVPKSNQPGQECKMINSNASGNTVSWKMECDSPQGKTLMDGKATYNGDTMNGEIRMQQAGTEMLQRMSGKRVGDCK